MVKFIGHLHHGLHDSGLSNIVFETEVSMKCVDRGILILAILFSMSLTSLCAQSALSVVSESPSGINLSFQLPDWSIETDQLSNSQKISLKDASYLFVDETETLPVFSTFIAIPPRGGVELSSRMVKQDRMLNLDLGFRAALNAKNNASGLYPGEFVSVSEPMIIRDLRVVCLTLSPFQYDPLSRELVYHQNIDISLSFNNRSAVNEMAASAKFARSFSPIYEGQVLNHSTYLTRDTQYQKPNLLVIYGYLNDPAYTTKLNEYVQWKKQLGYTVTAVSTQTTGSTSAAIKNYLQSAYDTWADKPDYVVLIGDVATSIAIPTFTESLHSGEGDYPYTFLAGNDMLGDVVIGRISVGTTAEFSLYVAKLLATEKDIDAVNSTWLNRMLLVGDTASSGISTIYTNRYIEDIASELNPSYTYTTMYQSGPSPTAMNAAINQGVGFFNYRGYIGMSGWGSTNITALLNNQRMGHAVIITCGTGNFAGTGTTELLVRRGSVTDMGGAITAIGMSTSSTHTSLNNCLNGGIFQGIMSQGMRDMGSALLNGKLYLNSVYGISNPAAAQFFAHIGNLIGDPTAKVYIGTAKTFNATHLSSLPAGSGSLEVVVRNSSNQVMEGVVVTLVQGTTTQVIAYTDASGRAVLSFPSNLTGSLTLTVDRPEYKPYTAEISIASTGNLVYNSVLIDDDNSGNSSGNANSIVNPGEVIELKVGLRNSSSTAVLAASATLTSNSPYVTIQSGSMTYPAIAVNAIVNNTTAARFSVSSACPDGQVLNFNLNGSSALGSFSFPFTIAVTGGRAELISYNLTDCVANIVEPGDISGLVFSIKNSGAATLSNVNAVLRSYNTMFAISDSLGSFGTITAGQTVSNSSNTFTIRALSPALTGMVVPLDLRLSNSAGYSQVLSLSLTIGQVQITDPIGQDAYGYYIFDDGDALPNYAPVYQWIGIAPAEGGSGTALSITDTGISSDEGDQVGSDPIEEITLPFNFKFYGRTYSTATISSNGFIAFGSTANAEFRNWRLPGALGPNPMIAAFWDDLATHTGGGIYRYYNATEHYLVIEWYNVRNGCDLTTPETFQVILYDPAYHQTVTGDGPIKIQYHTFNNVDFTPVGEYAHPHGNYSTVGIKDHFGTTGLEYTYNNSYPAAAKPLVNQSALYITTRSLPPQAAVLVVQNVDVNDSNSNHYLEAGETAQLAVQISNVGSVNATNVTATISTTDPYLSILNNYSAYGTIAAFDTASPLNSFPIQVASSFPTGHQATVNYSVNSSQGTWNGSFSLGLYAPVLSFGALGITEISGDHDGLVDPGETCQLIIPLFNSSPVSAQAGTATLSCSSPYAQIANNSVSFPALLPDSSNNLIFSISSLASTPVGTLFTLVFNASSGSFSVGTTVQLEVGAPTMITIGSGSQAQSYPLDRYYNYSVHEAIYLDSEIGLGGQIKSIAYNKTSGTDQSGIEAVSIYMKDTTESVMASGNYSLTGYTQVYSGVFPNTSASGWMEVNLNPMYNHESGSNLQILVVKGYQQWISAYPSWEYSSTPTSRARQERNDNAQPTTLSSTNNLPNLRLKIFPATQLFPPRNLTAQSSNRTVYLAWDAPSGQLSPNAYNIYRNSSLLYTQTERTYYDIDVANGNNYSYFVTAVYGVDESAATNTVIGSPSSGVAQFAVLGSGTSFTANNYASPINTSFKSNHGQSVYTAAELNAAGVTGPIQITQLGFYVARAPSQALPNFKIRMKHTTEVNGVNWHTPDGMSTVYLNPSYQPTAGGWEMLNLSTPFTWNGVDNILVDTAFSLLPSYANTGTLQYTTVTSGYRFTWSDAADQSEVFEGGYAFNRRANLRVGTPPVANGANISIASPSLDFGAVELNESATLPLVIQNTGQQTLAGRIIIPDGFSISESRNAAFDLSFRASRDLNRSEVRFDIAAGSSQTWYVSFNPLQDANVSATAVISTNAVNSPVYNLPLLGIGYDPVLETPNLSVTTVGNSVQLVWNAVTHATAYQIWKSNSPLGPFVLFNTVQDPAFTDSATERAFYYIKALRTFGTRLEP